MSSSHLNWLIVRDNNAFILKQRNIKKPFSKERNNLTNLSSYRYSGIVHSKTIGIAPADDKKGVVVQFRKGKKVFNPAQQRVSITFKAGPRRVLKKVKNVIKYGKYRRDLTQAALRRTSALLRSQRPVKAKAAKPAAATASTSAPAKPKAE